MLSEEQKKFILENFDKHPEILWLTRNTFKDEKLDGRSKEAKEIKAFLRKNGLKHKTTKFVKTKPEIKFTDEQVEFIINQAQNGLKSTEIAQMIFPDKKVVSLSLEQKSVFKVIQDSGLNNIQYESKGYNPPKSLRPALKKVNDYTQLGIEEEKLSVQQKKCLEQLIRYLHSPKFVKDIDSLEDKEDKNLFEGEFVRAVWDKVDLTVDELNLYINVCSDYVEQKNIKRRLEILNKKFEETEDHQDLTMRLVEMMKSLSSQLHECKNRIEKSISKLNGDRAKKREHKEKNSASILALIEAFQEEEERLRMIRLVELQNQAIEEEVDRLENMDEFKARILGISKRDVI